MSEKLGHGLGLFGSPHLGLPNRNPVLSLVALGMVPTVRGLVPLALLPALAAAEGDE